MIPAVGLSQKSTQQHYRPDMVSFQKAPSLGDLNILDGIERISSGSSFMENAKKYISVPLLVGLCAAGVIAWQIAEGWAKAHVVS